MNFIFIFPNEEWGSKNDSKIVEMFTNWISKRFPNLTDLDIRMSKNSVTI